MTHKHISRRIGRLLLSTLLSLSLTAASLTPLFATEAETPLQAAPDVISEAEPVPEQLSVSENTSDEEQSSAPIPETETSPATDATNIITITFYDTDGQTILFGPVEKDLSVLQFDASSGRYLFDTVNEYGASVSNLEGYYQLPWVHNGKSVSRWRRTSDQKSYTYDKLIYSTQFLQSDSFTAVYSKNYYTYQLSFDLNGAYPDDDAKSNLPDSFTVMSDSIELPSLYKKGCIFDGWEITNTSAGNAYGSVITSIPAGTYIDYTYGDLQNDVFTGYQLQAKWTPIPVSTPALTSVSNIGNCETSSQS